MDQNSVLSLAKKEDESKIGKTKSIGAIMSKKKSKIGKEKIYQGLAMQGRF